MSDHRTPDESRPDEHRHDEPRPEPTPPPQGTGPSWQNDDATSSAPPPGAPGERSGERFTAAAPSGQPGDRSAERFDGPSVVDEGFLETALGVVTDPVATLRAVTRQPKVGWAVWLTLGIGLLTALAGLADVGADPAADELLRDLPPELAELADLRGTFATVMVVAAPFLSLLWIAIVAGVLQVMGSLLGGDGRYRGMFAGVAFANVPSVFGVLTPLLAIGLGTVGAVLGSLFTFGLFVWVIVLGAIAVRENHDISTGRAAAAVLIPFAVGFLLLILVVVLIGVLIFSAFG